MRIKDGHKIHDITEEQPTPPLSKVEKEDLRRIIGKKVNQEKIDAIEKSFVSASYLFHKLNEVNLQPIAERKKSIDKMINAFKRVRLAIDEIDVFVEFRLDKHFEKVSEGKSIEKFSPNDYSISGFNNLIDLMEKTLKSYKKEIPNISKGKKANHDYTASINIISKAFLTEFPLEKISSSGTSRFLKIIQLWLNIIDPKNKNNDGEKHIKNYIKSDYFNDLY